MIIRKLEPLDDCVLRVVTDDGRVGTVDLGRYLESPVFVPLKNKEEFLKVRNCGYFIEWSCGADLSADTLEAQMKWALSESELLKVAEGPAEYKTKQTK